jgi:hypothetical protein
VKRLIVLSFILAVIFSTLLVSPSYAMPSFSGCSTGCTGDAYWTGRDVWGGQATIYVPNFPGNGSSKEIERYISFIDYHTGDQLNVGECFSNSGFECVNNSGNYFVTEYYFGSWHVKTFNMPSGDKTYTTQFGIYANCAAPVNGGCNDVQYYGIVINDEHSGVVTCPDKPRGQSGTACIFGPIPTEANQWSEIDIDNYVQATWSGTLQGTYTYFYNQWMNNDIGSCTTFPCFGQYIDQASAPGIVSPVGAQMKITVVPNGENNEGGTITGCNKDSGNTC